MIFQPDIVAVEQGEPPQYVLVVEVKQCKPGAEGPVLDQLKRYMSGMGCASGLLVTPERSWVLSDSYRSSGPESVVVQGEYPTPRELRLPDPGDGDEAEYEAAVQTWLERLAEEGGTPKGPRDELEDEIASILIGSEIRAGNPRRVGLEAAG